MEKVTENVYVNTKIRGCNPSIVLTSEGSVMIDTAQWITPLLEMIAFAKEHGPIRYLINLEGHIDHIFGNHWFKDLCPAIGHKNLLKNFFIDPKFDCYDYSVDVIQRQDPGALALMPKREEFDPNPPTITFTQEMSFKLGDTEFFLYYTPGHTDASITVHVPKERTIFTADTVFSGCQTWMHSADPGQWLRTLRFLRTLDFDYIVPGHGPVVEKSYLDKQISFILEWMSRVAIGISEGKSKEQCVAEISFADRCPMDIGQEESMEFVQTNNVRKLYDYLTKGCAAD